MSTSKVVIVTGASQGIGAETVKAFRAQGHRVVANAILYLDAAPFVTGEILHVDGDFRVFALARHEVRIGGRAAPYR